MSAVNSRSLFRCPRICRLTPHTIRVCLIAVLLLGPAPGVEAPSVKPLDAQSSLRISTALSLVRIPLRGPVPSASAVHLWTAGGEFESFQIVVGASRSRISKVNISVFDLKGPHGSSISKSHFQLYLEHYVHVSRSSPDLGGTNRPGPPGLYPDALIPFRERASMSRIQPAELSAAPFDIEANTNQPVWVDLFTPRNAAPGNYTGAFEVHSDQGSVTGKITVTVWNFSLPLTPTLKSSFAFGNGDAGTLGEEKELLTNKVSPISSAPENERTLIDDFGLTAKNLGFFSNANYGHCVMDAPPTVREIKRKAEHQQHDLFLYNYTADEIGDCTFLYDMLKQWARNLHLAGIKNLVT
ncbi:MAG: hypothetical protein JO061_05805, partial [Acidobacteriaceae bacterium]|nr:hypothetical protein [Acidobacteriaceae bacterium]